MSTPDPTQERGVQLLDQLSGQNGPDPNQQETVAKDQAEVKLLVTLEQLCDSVIMSDGPEQPSDHAEKFAHACLYLAQAYAAICTAGQKPKPMAPGGGYGGA